MKLVVFDFDGTLVRLDIPWKKVKEDALEIAKLYNIDIDANRPLLEIANILAEFPESKDPVYQSFRRYETACVESNAYKLCPGMGELIKDLKENGFTLAIASANCVETIEAVLGDLGLSSSFDLILGRDSVKRNKPDPEQLIQIMEKLNIAKEDVLYIGDLRYDELAAKAAGVKFFDLNGHGKKVGQLRKILL